MNLNNIVEDMTDEELLDSKIEFENNIFIPNNFPALKVLRKELRKRKLNKLI